MLSQPLVIASLAFFALKTGCKADNMAAVQQCSRLRKGGLAKYIEEINVCILLIPDLATKHQASRACNRLANTSCLLKRGLMSLEQYSRKWRALVRNPRFFGIQRGRSYWVATNGNFMMRRRPNGYVAIETQGPSVRLPFFCEYTYDGRYC